MIRKHSSTTQATTYFFKARMKFNGKMKCSLNLKELFIKFAFKIRIQKYNLFKRAYQRLLKKKHKFMKPPSIHLICLLQSFHCDSATLRCQRVSCRGRAKTLSTRERQNQYFKYMGTLVTRLCLPAFLTPINSLLHEQFQDLVRCLCQSCRSKRFHSMNNDIV